MKGTLFELVSFSARNFLDSLEQHPLLWMFALLWMASMPTVRVAGSWICDASSVRDSFRVFYIKSKSRHMITRQE
jgi:hypothetical protein